MTFILVIESNKLDDIVVVDEITSALYCSDIYIEVGE